MGSGASGYRTDNALFMVGFVAPRQTAPRAAARDQRIGSHGIPTRPLAALVPPALRGRGRRSATTATTGVREQEILLDFWH